MGGRGGSGGVGFASRTADVKAENQVKAAYRNVADQPGQWIKIADLRAKLSGMSREDQDAAIRRMARERTVHLAPQDYQFNLTAKDRAAAISFGGRNNHLLLIEDPSPSPLPTRSR